MTDATLSHANEERLREGRDDPRLAADRLVALIDAAVSRQLCRILQHPDFQAMEARWRGLVLLLRAAGGNPDVKVKILSASFDQLARSLERASEFDQSRLFELVYGREFDMPGGEPFGLLVGDYAVSKAAGEGERDPVAALAAIAGVSAAAFAPFICGASPKLADLDGYAELSRLPDVAHRREDAAAFRWARLRKREDTRFLGLVAPRVLLRGPRDPNSRRRVDGFAFREERHADGRHLLWGNGAFAFAALAVRRFCQTGWFADLRGAPQDAEGGGLVSALAPFDLGLESGGLSAQPPVEVRLTGAQEQAFGEMGLIPISTHHLSGELVFNANPSLHEPSGHVSGPAGQNARLSAMLQYVLCASRFAHTLKVILREEVGRLADRRTIQAKLDGWLSRYTLGNDDAELSLRTRFPLRLAQVEVADIAGRPGAFSCAVRLQPHFQLDDLATSFHLVAETAAAGANAARPAAEAA